MRILVTGGTGNIGGEVSRLLDLAGHQAVRFSRSGAGGVAGDLRNVAAVATAAAGCDGALLITPIGPVETAIGLAANATLRAAGIARIVYVGVMNIAAMAEIPHFAAKQPIRDAVLDGGGVVLDCNFFMQNDLLVLPAIVQGGIFPLPVGKMGVQPVDTRDIAMAAVRVLTATAWSAAATPLCGPDRLDGEGYAASWSTALGRRIGYGGDAIEPFIAAMRSVMGDLDAWLEHDFRVMMAVTQASGCPATPTEVAQAEQAVGRPLTSHRQFAATISQTQQEMMA